MPDTQRSDQSFCARCGIARSGHQFITGACVEFVARNPGGVPVERPATETTDRIPTRTPAAVEALRRANAARAMDTLTMSAMLEVAGEIARARYVTAVGKARDEIEMVAECLVELVGGLKDVGQ